MNSASEHSRPKTLELLESRRLLTAAGAALAFQLPNYISMGATAQITTAQVGDVDADGVADIVVAGHEASPAREAEDRLPFLSILLGTGAGYSERIDSPIPLIDVALADYDLDGSAEITGRDSNGDWIVLDWLASDKDPEKSSLVALESAPSLANLVSLGDFNQDGLVDVLTSDASEVFIQFGAEEDAEPETIATGVTLSESTTDRNTAVVDLDADGDLDIAALCDECAEESQLSFWVNDGGGEFALADLHIPLADADLNFLQAADIDRDGRVDLVLGLSEVVEASIDRVAAYRQAEGGEFELSYSVPFDQAIASIAIDDVDSDSLPEVVVKLNPNVANEGTTQVITGSSSSPQVITQSIGGSDQLVGVASGTFVSISGSNPGQLVTLSASPQTSGDAIDLFETSIYPNKSHLLDVDDDGALDVVGLSDGGISFLVGQDRGGFESMFLAIEDLESYSLQVGDFDTTPGSELVLVGNLLDGSGTVLRSLKIVEGQPTQTELLSTQRGVPIASQDLDNDGLLDFVFRSDFVSAHRSSSVLLNRGETWLERTLSTDSGTVAIEDLDGDGTMEAYVFENPIRVFKYQDDDFVAWGEIPKGTTRAEVLDLNSDGLKDFVSIRRQGGLNNVLTAMVANGDGTWQQWDDVTVTDYEFVDVNSDGLIDVVTPRHFFVSTGDGAWSISDELESESPVWAERNRYVDVNGDGIVDNAKLHINSGILDLQVSDGSAWGTVEGISVVADFELQDLNGDGLSDLLQMEDGSLTINYRVGDGWSESIEIADDARGYFVTNHNGDELRDFEIIRDTSYLTVTQDSFGEFVAGEPIETGATAIEDFDGDGVHDLRFIEPDALKAALQSVVWLGSEQGFAESETITLPQPETQWLGNMMWLTSDAEDVTETRLVATSLSASSIDPALPRATADIDGDGDLDIFAMSPNGLLVFYGRGDGDFDGNGKIESIDADLLRLAIDREDKDPRFDLNADEVLDEEDMQVWIREVGRTSPGDADLDGNVEFSDFLKFSINFGKETTNWSDGDFDGDGIVSFTDFLSLSRFFGSSRLK